MPLKIHRSVLKDTEGHFKLCKYFSFSNQMSYCGFERIIQRLFLLELPCHLGLKWVAQPAEKYKIFWYWYSENLAMDTKASPISLY